ncbi:two component transcriptional regulator, LuxR family [Streptoalloteichus tenebrarius]|uniref:Two component transcriptional regulator, LuxR family n=1 Tax=Streptoalloteichus tenebrarius (strain ATCC 17920 / DSM 40477 / JCM 4838 / CBS 697.72 / NBRC 16177 / NCIMB 11028 / NRRL B-12390 / A12253. 1 / ISP 5477) TaxID=1933 RepID=A0ABT1I0J0_STRSD|nr:response regulator transcription factor [Streptoalloteichus tenebrarius]MCP2261302.1 two component transcriptional regulator, LuxR family [Streptoalloteichus tenebrarius]BFF03701.1 response regulator transcription factor [Streptoalloteichus tenebrarius]
MVTTLLVVDDQPLVRAGLRMLFGPQPEVEVVGEAANGREAVELAERLRPDVVLMDLRMPVLDGIGATKEILARRPATRIIVLTTFDDDEHLYPALTAGACGFLAKDAPPEELLAAVEQAARGRLPFSRDVLGRIVRQAVDSRSAEARSTRPVPHLSPRERQVLALLAAGLSNSEIAQRLHLGVTTVKTHIAGLMAKTGCANRVQLAVLAVQLGLSVEDGRGDLH